MNASGRKIGGADLAPVTQLFTEHYMVTFLLENSLGAWWAARHPDSPLLQDFTYLRFKDDGTPAAGTFPGWPERAAEVTVMDPCCGSGHFLAAAFAMLRQMRMEEERLAEADAADAVLRDNLFGLEIDARCTQIAAFALALAAWKAGGYRTLPIPHIACSGIPVRGQWETWEQIAGDDQRLVTSLRTLYTLFQQAPDLGSLIDPARSTVPDRRYDRTIDGEGFDAVEPLLHQAMAREKAEDDPSAAVFGEAAAGVASAAALLAGRYTLVATNVPYLARGKQSPALADFCESRHPEAKGDLATTFLERCRALTHPCGGYAVVTPQNWLFLGTYHRLREQLLKEQSLLHVSWLGPGAFETISGEVVKAALVILSNEYAGADQRLTGIDASLRTNAGTKAEHLRDSSLRETTQAAQLRNPDARITLTELSSGELLERYATAYIGLHVGEWSRYRRSFWEIPVLTGAWRTLQNTLSDTTVYYGLEDILYWPSDGRIHKENPSARVQGVQAWGRRGVAISMMDKLPATMYLGGLFRNGVAAIIPSNQRHLSAIWAYCASSEFNNEVRRIDQKLYVTCGTLVKIPFDLAYWQAVADAAGPLPEPYSNDPTQWLFKGDPLGSTAPLQVAVARLLGYRWPEQADDGLEACIVPDGIACLPAVAGQPPAAERLRALLAAALGVEWSPRRQEELLAGVGFGGKGLEAWLRDGFFTQHCKLFHNRPFIWQIWDGRRDGFSALVNYHTLDAARLNALIYSYLGQWIEGQRRDAAAGVAGAEGRLVAALRLQEQLQAIQAGEPPYDVYIRWKLLRQQPIGWQPDLNDGVRLNVRPFVTAGILRDRFTVNWNKDRGHNPDGSERVNDVHLTNAEKRAGRE